MARYDVVKFPWAGIFPGLCDPASHIFSSARNSLILEELAAQWCQSVRPKVMDLSKLNSHSPNFQDTYIVFGGPIIWHEQAISYLKEVALRTVLTGRGTVWEFKTTPLVYDLCPRVPSVRG